MRLLLDTHIFPWYITGDQRIAQSVRTAIEDSEVAYLSVAAVWEATGSVRLAFRIGVRASVLFKRAARKDARGAKRRFYCAGT